MAVPDSEQQMYRLSKGGGTKDGDCDRGAISGYCRVRTAGTVAKGAEQRNSGRVGKALQSFAGDLQRGFRAVFYKSPKCERNLGQLKVKH